MVCTKFNRIWLFYLTYFKSETKSKILNINKIATLLYKVCNQQILNVNDYKDMIEISLPILQHIGNNLLINDRSIITNSVNIPVKIKNKKKRNKKWDNLIVLNLDLGPLLVSG